MKAIVRERYGGPDILEIQELEKPNPKAHEVLVKVYATTVNRTDCGGLTGKPYAVRLFTGFPNPKNKIPGTDFAGQIESIGASVSQFKVGDKVWGLNDDGFASQAQYMTIDENNGIINMPEKMSYDEAVACAEGAHYAINFINKVNLPPECKVLLNGSTGGIGSAAAQILKSKGIYVTAVGNTKNEELVRSFGVDKFYNYEKEDFTELENEKYDFVFDAVGKSTFGKCKPLLKEKGIYISSELGPGAENLYLPLITKLKGGKRVIFPIPSDCKGSLEYMKALIERGEFKAVIDRHYSMEQIKEAYEYVASGQKTGNVIINYH